MNPRQVITLAVILDGQLPVGFDFDFHAFAVDGAAHAIEPGFAEEGFPLFH